MSVYIITGEKDPVYVKCGYCGEFTPIWGMTPAKRLRRITLTEVEYHQMGGEDVAESHQKNIYVPCNIKIGPCCQAIWDNLVLAAGTLPEGRTPILPPFYLKDVPAQGKVRKYRGRVVEEI